MPYNLTIQVMKSSYLCIVFCRNHSFEGKQYGIKLPSEENETGVDGIDIPIHCINLFWMATAHFTEWAELEKLHKEVPQGCLYN